MALRTAIPSMAIRVSVRSIRSSSKPAKRRILLIFRIHQTISHQSREGLAHCGSANLIALAEGWIFKRSFGRSWPSRISLRISLKRWLVRLLLTVIDTGSL